MRGLGSTTAPPESRRCRGRARSKHTSCAIGPAKSSGSSSTRVTIGTSPAIWNGSSGRWRRGRRPIRATVPHGLLSGFATRSTGKYELSIDEASKAIALDPDLAPHYSSKAFSELLLHRLADAEATVSRASERRLEETFLFVAVLHCFLKGDAEDIRQKAGLARGKRSTEDMISHLEALALARSGRLQEARRTSAVAVDVAKRVGQRERAALFAVATAVWEAFYGNAAAARQRATTVLELARGRDVDYAAAFVLALSGDVTRARTLASDLDQSFPRIRRCNTCICRRWGTVLIERA